MAQNDQEFIAYNQQVKTKFQPGSSLQQVKYGVVAPVEIQHQTLYGALPPTPATVMINPDINPGGVEFNPTMQNQVKYGVVCQPGAPTLTQEKYGVVCPEVASEFIPEMPTQVKYGVVCQPVGAPTLTQEKYGVVCPEVASEFLPEMPTQVKYGVVCHPIGEEMNPTANQVKYGVICTGDDTAIAGLVTDSEESKNTEKMLENLADVINDLKTFNGNSGYVRGSFGEALAYSSDVIGKNVGSLKNFTENNMLQAMNSFGQYQNNITKIKTLLSQDIGDFSMSQFDADGTFIPTNDQKGKLNINRVRQAEVYFKENIKLKNQMQALADNKINRN